ncbi:MAG: DnaJ domain-containing protein [Candidatus Obscuribacterales bacterium]|nr:DnaJ domain-containing protein [Candidatus Obscuribacterales bacterium]
MDSSKQQGLKDYYYILGVSPEASAAQIQAAYQELYDKFGPHVTLKEQDPEAMVKAYKDIVEAFEVLGDPGKRQEYDKVALPVLQKSHLRNLWGKLTGVKADETRSKDDAPESRLILELTLREAIKGARKILKVEDIQQCQTCISKKPVDRTKCLNCHGSGMIRSERSEELIINPGIVEKQEIRMPGKGKFDTRSRRHGDLIVELQIIPHPFFTVIGKDISCTVPVTIYEAILGGEIEAPTPTGRVVMKIQPLTQRGRVYRLKGLGLAGGDLMVSIEVLVPSQLHADEVELFRKLQLVSSQPNPRADVFAKLQALNQAQAAGPQSNS